MYKNILIVGSSKCGKTSLANKISDKYNCNVISLDYLIQAFEETFPKEDNDNYKEFEVRFITNYLKQVFATKNFYEDKKTIIEGNVPYLDDILPTIDQKKLSIIGLTYNNVSLKQFIVDLKNNASRFDVIRYLSDDLVEEKALIYMKENSEISNTLEKNDINCYDVSENREEIFEQIVEDIDKLTSYGSTYKVKKIK